jgi:Clostripain family
VDVALADIASSWKGHVRKKEGAPSWTVMIFMGADTLRRDDPLPEAVDDDLAEIRAVGLAEIRAVGERANHNLDIFVQVHGRGDPYRLHFGRDMDGKPIELEAHVPLGQVDNEDGQALSDFIESSTLRVGHRRDDRSMLVLWGHAYDFAFGRSLTPGGAIESLDFLEISQTLRRLQTRMLEAYKERDNDRAPELPKLDIIGFDTCDVATVEIAYQLEPFADFLLGSQVGVPIPGWPYHRILDRLQNPKGDLPGPPELGAYAVRRFCASYGPSIPVTLTLLNLKYAPRLSELVEALAVELAIAIGNPPTRDRVTELFFESQTEAGKPFVDAADLCLNLLGSKQYPFLSQKALELGNYLVGRQEDVVVGLSDQAAGWPLIAEHGRNSGELVRLNGLSLYAPHIALPGDPGAVRQLYDKFKFVQKTRWGKLVHDLAGLR